jgi:hypothetical protein
MLRCSIFPHRNPVNSGIPKRIRIIRCLESVLGRTPGPASDAFSEKDTQVIEKKYKNRFLIVAGRGHVLGLGTSLALLILSVSGAVAADELSISAPYALEALSEEPDGHWRLMRLDRIEQAAPGDLLMVSQEFQVPELPLTQTFSLTLAIPPGLQYLPGTAVGPGSRQFASVDNGQVFEADVRESGEREAGSITHLRWVFPGTLHPGVRGTVRYRARRLAPPAPLVDVPAPGSDPSTFRQN